MERSSWVILLGSLGHIPKGWNQSRIIKPRGELQGSLGARLPPGRANTASICFPTGSQCKTGGQVGTRNILGQTPMQSRVLRNMVVSLSHSRCARKDTWLAWHLPGVSFDLTIWGVNIFVLNIFYIKVNRSIWNQVQILYLFLEEISDYRPCYTPSVSQSMHSLFSVLNKYFKRKCEKPG